MRDDAQTKAARMCASGRVAIRSVTDACIRATVKGDSARIYTVTYDPSGWRDDCDAVGKCSHIRAVQLCTLEPIGVRR